MYVHTLNLLMYVYMCRTKLAQVFTVDEVRHVFLPQKAVVNSYVLKVRAMLHSCAPCV